jgi:hypothetical protein
MRVFAIAFMLIALLLAGNALAQITSAQSGEWRLTTTWVGGSVPTATDNVVIAAAHTISVDDLTSVCHSLSFGATTSLIKMNANSSLTIYGNFTLFSTTHCVFSPGWSATNARVIFGGSEDQTISGFNLTTGSTAFRDLVVNKPAGTVSTAGGNQIIGIQQTFEIISGTFVLGAGDDIEERIATSGARWATPKHLLAITVQADGILRFADGSGDHWVRSGLGSHPIGPVIVYGQMGLYDASSSDISFSGMTIKDGGEFTIGTGMGSTTDGPMLNCGTITIEDGGTLVSIGTANPWFVSDGLAEHPNAAVNLQDGGIFEVSGSSVYFPTVFTDNGKVRYTRNSTTTDQTIFDRGYNRAEFSFPSDGSRNKNWTLTGSRQIVDSLTINNKANLVLSAASAQTLTIGNTVRLTSGILNNTDTDVTMVVTDGATISRATGTILTAPQFAGTANIRYTSTVDEVTTGPELPTNPEVINNLTSIASAGVLMGADAQVNGTLLLDGGNLNTNGHLITLGNTATIDETTGDIVQGRIDITRDIVSSTEETFGGLGLSITALGTTPGLTHVLRVTGIIPDLGGGILGASRYFMVDPTNNSGLNATIVLAYSETELNGIAEADLSLYSSPDGGVTWTERGGMVDAVANTITVDAVNSFSMWAFGPASPPLQITCPDAITVSCLADVPAPDITLVAVGGGCTNPVVSFVSDVQTGSGCSLTITRTYRATDDCNSDVSCTQIITVQDQVPPQLAGCPENITLDCGGLPPAATVTATDNCDANVAVVFGEVTTPGNCAYNYTVTRTWTATDVCGNQAQCQQIITVQDVTPPQIACPAPITVECVASVPQPNTALVTVSDNCDPAPAVTFVSDVYGTQRCPAQITRTYRATDACGNQATCTQIITVDDQTAPIFTTFPSDQSIFQCQTAQICLPIAATDNCLGGATLSVTSGQGSIAAGQWCVTPTATTIYNITVRATDTCGNYVERTFRLDYRLNTRPTIANCPGTGQAHWGQTYTFDLNATDPDSGDDLTFSLCPGASASASINATTGVVQFTPRASEICNQTICVIVKDECNAADTCSIDVCVVNDPPVIASPGNQTICDGYPFATQVTATDADNGPYKFFNLISGPLGMQVNSATGAVTWSDPIPGTYPVCISVTDSAAICTPCSPANSDTACFTVRVASLDLVIEKVHDQIQGQYTNVDISFLNQGTNWPIAGYDFLIKYDASALSFQRATEGKFYTDCSWEYFTYRFGANGNCGAGACPSGVLRIIALSETTGGNLANHPDCYTNDGVADPGPGLTTATQLATMVFLVSDDRTLECQYVPIRFFWYDCADNSLSNVQGDTLFMSHQVFDYAGESGDPAIVQWTEITAFDNVMPSLTGAPSPECDLRAKFEVVRCANFYNGGVDIICADSIDAPGDINLNGIAYEVADAVMLTNYFVNGLSAFGAHVDGSVAASDTNHDGLTLSVADLVLLIRVIVGDCLPYTKDTPIATISTGFSVENGVVTVAGNVDISGAALVVRGNLTPELLATDMAMTYAFDGEFTRIIVISPIDATSMHSFRGAFIAGITGEIVSLELATSQGASVTTRIVPAQYTLDQNYPNPFNPATTITFALPQASEYRLTIYNIEGRVVDVFNGQADAPGVFRVDWNAGDRASGVYLYRLDAGSFTQTRKMLLLK